jgi:hypothetical protein
VLQKPLHVRQTSGHSARKDPPHPSQCNPRPNYHHNHDRVTKSIGLPQSSKSMVDGGCVADMHMMPIAWQTCMDAKMDADIEEIATRLGESLIQQILENKPLDDIKGSLDVGAPVWYQTSTEGTSALHAAAYVQNDSLVRLLIEKGAVWNAGSPFNFLEVKYMVKIGFFQWTIRNILQGTSLCHLITKRSTT